MHLHTCIVSYKRRALTEQCLASYLETVSIPHTLVIVDNGSPRDVRDWLARLDGVGVRLLDRNYFPGYATNRGWEVAPEGTTLFQRLNPDTRLLPGWCEPMVTAFEDPTVGQYGLTGEGDERWIHDNWPVGGNSVIRRELYDAGLRYDELPWTHDGGHDECVDFYRGVIAMGWRRVFGPPTIEYLDDGDPEYRAESRHARGLV